MSKEIQQNSQNSLTLYEQRKTVYLEAVEKVLDATAKEPTIKIINAALTPRILGDVSLNHLVDKVSKWRMMVGSMRDIDGPQLVTEAKYLKSQHGSMKESEFDLAVEFFMTQRIKVKNVTNYLNFSCLFMSQVIDGYEFYRAELLKPVLAMAGQPKELPMTEVTIQEKVDNMKYFIRESKKNLEEWEAKKNAGKLSDEDMEKEQSLLSNNIFNNTAYSFLRLTGRLVPDDKLKTEATDYAKKQYALIIANSPISYLKNSEGRRLTVNKYLKQFKFDYYLLSYFKNNDIEKVIDSITEDDYTKFLENKEALAIERIKTNPDFINGVYFGYPLCCIKFYVDHRQTLHKNMLTENQRKAYDLGYEFLPCPECADKCIAQAVRPHDLIKDRMHSKPFPEVDTKEYEDWWNQNFVPA